MTRLLALAISLTLPMIGSGVAAAHDGHHPSSGCSAGCSGIAQPRAAYDSSPYTDHYHSYGTGGCQGGACSSLNQPNFRSAPVYRQPQTPYVSWDSPAVPNRSLRYEPTRQYNSTPQPAPYGSQPVVPPSRPFFNSPPPLPSQAQQQPVIPRGMEGVAQLTIAEQRVALQQRTCPVTKEPLGSMGKPIRVNVAGRLLFVCCEGCVNALQRNPGKYLSNASLSESSLLR